MLGYMQHHCCCAGGGGGGGSTPCSELMCIPENPSTVLVSNISGFKRYQITQQNYFYCNDTIPGNCAFTDFDSWYSGTGPDMLQQVNFTMLPAVLRRSGTNCCYIADDASVELTWSYYDKIHHKCCCNLGSTSPFCPGQDPCPPVEWENNESGSVVVPACYRVDCVQMPNQKAYLVHRLSWCSAPGPGVIYNWIPGPANGPSGNGGWDCCNPVQEYVQRYIWIAPQRLVWVTEVKPLVDLTPADMGAACWCKNKFCEPGGDSTCTSGTQTVYSCLEQDCQYPGDTDYPDIMRFLTEPYDPENPPLPCSQCNLGPQFTTLPCGGVADMCYGGMHENNTPCQDCEYNLAVSYPIYS